MRYLILFIISLSVFESTAQTNDNPFTDSIKNNLAKATSTYDKVFWMGELSNFYTPIDKTLADDYAMKQQELAEQSRSRELIIMALLSNAKRYTNFSSVQNMKLLNDYANKALKMAQDSRLDDYQASAYMYLAEGARADTDYDKALNYNNLAVSLLATGTNDSLKNIAYLSQGNTYLRKGDKMLAFRNFLEALNVAESTRSTAEYYMLRDTYYSLSSFYRGLEEWEKAKDYLYKAMALTYKYKKRVERLQAYNAIGRLYGLNNQFEMAERFFDRAVGLADTLKFELIKLNTYSYMMNMYIQGNQPKKTLDLFKRKPELLKFITNAGFDHMVSQMYGMAYTGSGKYDSALYFFKKAEADVERSSTRGNKVSFYYQLATLYNKRKDSKNALLYWKKAEAIANETGDLNQQKAVAQNLDSVYQSLGDFKNAYAYKQKYHVYTDSLRKLATEKDVMQLEVDSENRRHERDALRAEEETRTRHNLQYMGITVAIIVVFIVLITLGLFRVSPATIRALGFFAFILLFEFIILLADNQIHHWTHGEPWKVLAIKIGLISVLLPLHHFVEEKVVHYLLSKKMLTMSGGQWLARFRRQTIEEQASQH